MRVFEGNKIEINALSVRIDFKHRELKLCEKKDKLEHIFAITPLKGGCLKCHLTYSDEHKIFNFDWYESHLVHAQRRKEAHCTRSETKGGSVAQWSEMGI